MEKEKEYSLIPYFVIILRNRYLLLLCTLSTLILGTALTVLMPAHYRASATIVPLESQAGGDNLRALAGQLGFDLSTLGSQTAYSQLIPAILRSRSMTEMLMDHSYRTTTESSARTLASIWRIEPSSRIQHVDVDAQLVNELHEMIDDRLRIRTDRETGALDVLLETGDPLLSAELVNTMVSNLEAFLVEFRSQEAFQRRDFITGRSRDVERELEQAEEALKEFRENNTQLNASPTLRMQEARLQRDVNVLEGVYVTLQQEYERARIDASLDYAPVRILDRANVPIKKYSPRPVLNLLLSLAIGLFLGLCVIFLRHYWILSIADESYLGLALRESVSDLKRQPLGLSHKTHDPTGHSREP